MPDASPAKWHLAHTTWFFEALILQAWVSDYRWFDERFPYLFNSYYNALGERHQRPQRGLLTRPSLEQVLAYRSAIDQAMLALLESANGEVQRLCEIGLNHEQQHQELLLTDIQHAFYCNPLKPAYQKLAIQNTAASRGEASWRSIEAGVYNIGHESDTFCYDNETPRHPVYQTKAAVCDQLVSNAEYLHFIEAGGYENPDYWLSDAWDWIQAERISAPLYWQLQEQLVFSLDGLQPIQWQAPVRHLSFYEADAYARFAGARLPTEAEWEICASGAGPGGDWFGHLWQWTASPYQAYPGYQVPDGPLAEYNAKFMCNQMVLRGSSAFTPAGHSRSSYRNFFPPTTRWQLSGVRLARDLP